MACRTGCHDDYCPVMLFEILLGIEYLVLYSLLGFISHGFVDFDRHLRETSVVIFMIVFFLER